MIKCIFFISSLFKDPMKLSNFRLNFYYSMNMEEGSSLCEKKFKIVFLGDMFVGKTSIVERFIKGNFDHAKTQVFSPLTSAYCRNRLPSQKCQPQQLHISAPFVGYSRPGKI